MIVDDTCNHVSSSASTSGLPASTVEYLKTWMMSPEHISHPYPTDKEKIKIMTDTGIGLKQLTNWFVNNRKRYWKPLVVGAKNKNKHRALKSTCASPESFIPNCVDTLKMQILGAEDNPTASVKVHDIISETTTKQQFRHKRSKMEGACKKDAKRELVNVKSSSKRSKRRVAKHDLVQNPQHETQVLLRKVSVVGSESGHPEFDESYCHILPPSSFYWSRSKIEEKYLEELNNRSKHRDEDEDDHPTHGSFHSSTHLHKYNGTTSPAVSEEEDGIDKEENRVPLSRHKHELDHNDFLTRDNTNQDESVSESEDSTDSYQVESSVTRHDIVDVHILASSASDDSNEHLSIDNVVVTSHEFLPQYEKILKTYSRVNMSYSFSKKCADYQEVLDKRNQAVGKMKEQYFAIFQNQLLSLPKSGQNKSSVLISHVSSDDDNDDDCDDDPAVMTPSYIVSPEQAVRSKENHKSLKRVTFPLFSIETNTTCMGHPKYPNVSPNHEELATTTVCSKENLSKWRYACLHAKHGYNDLTLPSLEEATFLFGFTK